MDGQVKDSSPLQQPQENQISENAPVSLEPTVPQEGEDSVEMEELSEMGVFLNPGDKLVASETKVIAHNANTLLLIQKAHEFGATDIELDLRFSREPYVWSNHRLHVRHSQLPIPFRNYPTPAELIESVAEDKTVVLDLKFLPKHPLEGRSSRAMNDQIRRLLAELDASGRTNLALTGGNEELFSTYSEDFPHIELRWTVWTERGYRRLKEKYDEKVKAVAVWSRTLKDLGMHAFHGKKVYVFGAKDHEVNLFKKMGVAGIGTDGYKNGKIGNVLTEQSGLR